MDSAGKAQRSGREAAATTPQGMAFVDAVAALIPSRPASLTDRKWENLMRLLDPSGIRGLSGVPQDPMFHGEGDVMAHTRLVVNSLCSDGEFLALPDHQRVVLFLATALHDLGKLRTTRLEGDGRWHAPNHSPVGSRMVREFLWQECGMSGSRGLQAFRESVCALVRHHMLPSHLPDWDDPARKAREVAAAGTLATDVSLHALCLLGRADVSGRVSDDMEEGLDQVELTRMFAEEAGCLRSPYRFPDGHTRYAYLSGRGVAPDVPLYDGTWGEVTLVCGLAGTGKDTWKGQSLPDVPSVSLDDIRVELGVRPSDNQGQVIQVAQERARELLRRRQSFVWNATSLTSRNRQRVTSLAERYGAHCRIVFLETGWETGLARNGGRDAKVPEDVIARMLSKLEPPMPHEAQSVEWLCV